MIERFKPDFSTTKNKIFFGIKVAVAIVYTILFAMIFVNEYYYSWDVLPDVPVKYFELSRVIFPIVLYIVGMLIIFFNPKWSNKKNTIATLVLSGISIIVTFYITQFSIITDNDYLIENYNMLNMRIIFVIFNLFILTTFFLLIYSIFGSFKVSIITLSVGACIISLVNYFVTLFRGTALIAVDFTNTSTGLSVAGGYEYRLHYRIVILLMVTIIMCTLALKLDKNPVKFLWVRALAIVATTLCLVVGYSKIWNSNHYDKLIKVKYFKPQRSFIKKGFYITFLKSIKDLKVKEPDNYSVKKVEELADKYKGTKAKTEDKPNVIVIMNEAFCDFSSLCDLKINKDNLPFVHSLKENTVKGRLYVPVYGGGTVSTEFESLTGNSMAFVPNGITCYTTYLFDPMASLASNLKKQGYGRAEALHPYRKADYKRDKVYDYFGFDKFYDMEKFGENPELCGAYISDNADANKLIKYFKKYRKKSDKPYFMFNVTMQNHSPFLSGNVSGGYKLKYPSAMVEANEYMNLISHSDAALKKIVEYFKSIDEKTIIVFYGDHQPKVEEEFYVQTEKSFKIKNIPVAQQKRVTNYYIWANYDIEEKEQDISSNYLPSLILDTAGLAKSGYDQFASEVMKEVPVVSIYGCLDKNGVSFNALDKVNEHYNLMNLYNIAQYNNIHDVDHRVDKFFQVK